MGLQFAHILGTAFAVRRYSVEIVGKEQNHASHISARERRRSYSPAAYVAVQ
jgi:hypothetical protein